MRRCLALCMDGAAWGRGAPAMSAVPATARTGLAASCTGAPAFAAAAALLLRLCSPGAARECSSMSSSFGLRRCGSVVQVGPKLLSAVSVYPPMHLAETKEWQVSVRGRPGHLGSRAKTPHCSLPRGIPPPPAPSPSLVQATKNYEDTGPRASESSRAIVRPGRGSDPSSSCSH